MQHLRQRRAQGGGQLLAHAATETIKVIGLAALAQLQILKALLGIEGQEGLEWRGGEGRQVGADCLPQGFAVAVGQPALGLVKVALQQGEGLGLPLLQLGSGVVGAQAGAALFGLAAAGGSGRHDPAAADRKPQDQWPGWPPRPGRRNPLLQARPGNGGRCLAQGGELRVQIAPLAFDCFGGIAGGHSELGLEAPEALAAAQLFSLGLEQSLVPPPGLSRVPPPDPPAGSPRP